jgi:hypothetical protein
VLPLRQGFAVVTVGNQLAMNQRLVLLSLAAGALAAALVACAAGGRQMKSQAPVATDAAPPGTDGAVPPLGGRPDEMRAKIAQLDEEILRDMQEAQVEPPDATMSASMASTPMADVRQVCEHAPGDRCEDVCKLSGSICDNASSICDIAAQLPGDAWAEERCGAAKASCKRATERCCSGDCAKMP